MTFSYMQARHYGAGNQPVNRIVIHRMEAPAKEGIALRVARYFATTNKAVSAHYCVDDLDIVGCVQEYNMAYHAPPNRNSIGVELAGYSADNDWNTAYSQRMLAQAVDLVAGISKRHSVPVIWLSPDDLRAGKRGLTSHRNVSAAFGQTSHTDPGSFFPVDTFVAAVKRILLGADKMQILYRFGVAGHPDTGKVYVTDLLYRRFVDDTAELAWLESLLGKAKENYVPAQLHDSLRPI